MALQLMVSDVLYESIEIQKKAYRRTGNFDLHKC